MSDESGDLESEQFLDPAETAVLLKGCTRDPQRGRWDMSNPLVLIVPGTHSLVGE